MQGILEDAARPYEPYELQSQQRPSQPNRTFKHTSFVGVCVCVHVYIHMYILICIHVCAYKRMVCTHVRT